MPYPRAHARRTQSKRHGRGDIEGEKPIGEPSASWLGRPITSNVSTARCDNGFLGWCVRRYRSRRTWPIISVPSSTSFAITTSPKVQPYLDSTTQKITSTFSSKTQDDPFLFLDLFFSLVVTSNRGDYRLNLLGTS